MAAKSVMRPNVLIFTVHDLGCFLGTYGHPVATPNLERFAREGVVFENHFSQGTVCSPSRGSIVTGCYPHTNGLMGLVHRGWALDVNACRPLPGLLRDNGYETHLFGFQHEHFDASLLGYQEEHPVASNHADQVADRLVDWLRKRQATSDPFFVGAGTSEVHRLGMNPSGFKHELYVPADRDSVSVPPWMPDIPEIREDLADFYGCISFMDRQFGRVLDALEETGLAKDTVVVFTTDHGASFLHGKASVYDGGTKVALQVRAPGLLPTGARVQALTSHVDLLPTLLELLDVKAPARLQGSSFLDEVRGAGSGKREYVYGEKNYTNYYDPARWVRSSRFKYIRKGLRTNVFDFVIPELELQRADFRRVRTVWDFYSPTRCTEELYDLETDPGELNNLAPDKVYANTLNNLRLVLDRHMERTEDPFRHLRNDLLMTAETYRQVVASRRHREA